MKELVASTLRDEVEDVKVSKPTSTKAEIAFERAKRKKVWHFFSFVNYGFDL